MSSSLHPSSPMHSVGGNAQRKQSVMTSSATLVAECCSGCSHHLVVLSRVSIWLQDSHQPNTPSGGTVAWQAETLQCARICSFRSGYSSAEARGNPWSASWASLRRGQSLGPLLLRSAFLYHSLFKTVEVRINILQRSQLGAQTKSFFVRI